MSDLIRREDAIDVIKGIDRYFVRFIKDLPSAQPEITQEDVELYCRRRCLTLITDELYNEMKIRWSAQPEPKKGKWLRYGEDGYLNSVDTVHWQCDQCLESYFGRTKRIPNYCPNCGAKMEG